MKYNMKATIVETFTPDEVAKCADKKCSICGGSGFKMMPWGSKGMCDCIPAGGLKKDGKEPLR